MYERLNRIPELYNKWTSMFIYQYEYRERSSTWCPVVEIRRHPAFRERNTYTVLYERKRVPLEGRDLELGKIKGNMGVCVRDVFVCVY